MSKWRKDKRIAKWNKLTLRNNFMFRLVMEKQELCKKSMVSIAFSAKKRFIFETVSHQ